MITQDELKEKLNYDKKTGEFTWRKTGRIAGFAIVNKKYWGIGVNRKTYRRCRLAWLYVYGKFPDNEVDHINGDRMDDRIKNLRDVTRRENLANYPRHRNGYLVGTTFDKNRRSPKKWMSRCKTNGISKFLGYYNTQKEAHEAYKEYINT